MLFWVSFRVLQFFRMIRSIGIGLLLVAIVITAGIWGKLLDFLASANVVQITAISLLVTGWIHLKRSDRRFLEKGSLRAQMFCALDYGLLLLPLTALLLVLGVGFAAFAALSGLVWAMLPPGLLFRESRILSQRLLPLIPVKAIEWRYIFRKYGFVMFCTIGLFAATFVHLGFYIGGQFLLWTMVMSGFEYTESANLLPCTREEAFKRWRQSALILHLMAAPGYLLLPFHGFNYAWMALYGFVANESLLLLCFAWKWATWYPGRYHPRNAITLSLALLFLILPGFAVIPLIQGIYYAKKAIHNLNLK